MIDLTKMSPAPWVYDYSFVPARTASITLAKVFVGAKPSCLAAPEPFCVTGKGGYWLDRTDFANMQFIALARNDLDVQRRRGWHVAKCIDSDQWYCPQLAIYLFANPGAIEVAYQDGHPVGLLTNADAWYAANVEGKV